MPDALTATLRTEFGKGAARRARRAGTIPAVLYGHGQEPVHLTLPGHETFMAIKGRANALLNLDIAGRTEIALVKDIQRDPVKQVIEHIDLVAVRHGEQVSVDIPIAVIGEPTPGTAVSVDVVQIKVEAEATHLPAHIEVDVTDLVAGAMVRAGDIKLPKGVTLVDDPAIAILSVV